MANPHTAFLSALLSGQAVAGSSSLTVTLAITSGFEVRVPVQSVQASNVSAAPEVYAYRAVAGAAGTPKYETQGATGAVFTRTASGDQTDVIVLDTGMWCLQLLSGGPNTASFLVLTQEVITAYA